MASLSDEGTDGSSGSLQISDSEVVCTFPKILNTSSSNTEEETGPVNPDEKMTCIPGMDESQKQEMENCIFKSLKTGEVLFFPKDLSTHIDQQSFDCLVYYLKGNRAVVLVSQTLNKILMTSGDVPKKWMYDVYIISPDQPVIILSFVKKRSEKATDVLYNTNLSRAFTKIVRREILPNFSVVSGVIEQDMCKLHDDFCQEIRTFSSYAKNACVPTSLQMNETRHIAVLKTITTRLKTLDSVPTKTDTPRKITHGEPLMEDIELKESITLTNAESRKYKKSDKDLHKDCVDKGLYDALSAELEDTRQELEELKRIALTRSRSFTSSETVSSGYISEEEEGDQHCLGMGVTFSPTFDVILDRTSTHISSVTDGMIRLSAVQVTFEKLQAGQRWITLTGQAGEGKTTTGYMVLKEMRDKGYEVFSVDSPNEYRSVREYTGRCIIMVDDIFGHLDINPILLTEWANCFQNEKRDRKDTSSSFQVILVIQASILDKSITFLPEIDNEVIDLTKSVSQLERLSVLNHYLRSQGIDCSDDDKNQITSANMQYGFAHSCRMYSYLGKSGSSVRKFFQNPVLYLEQAIKASLESNSTLLLFKRMLKFDGEVKMIDVREPYLKKAINSAMKDPSTNWLLTKNDAIKFSHPSINESVALVVGRNDPLFAVMNFSLSFILQKMTTLTSNQLTRGFLHLNLSKHNLTKHLLRRFTAAMKMNNYSVLTHSACHSESFFRNLLKSVLTEEQSTSDNVQLILKGASRERIQSHNEILKKLNSTDKLGQTMLKVTAGNGNTSAVKVLLDFGADINKHSSDMLNGEYKSVLHHLCEGKADIGVVDLLLKYKAGVNLPDGSGRTPLHSVCRHEPVHLGLMSLLLQNGAWVNMYDHSGHTPMHILCSRNKFDFGALDLLIKHGGNVRLASKGVTAEKKSPLHYICASDDISTSSLELLIKHGAEINATDANGKAPLHFIRHFSQSGRSAFELLIKHGADINLCDNDGKSVLHYQSSRNDIDVSSIEFLIEHEIDVSKCDTDGKTALHYICDQDTVSKQCIEMLVNHNANVNRLMHRGLERRSILHCLYQKKHVDLDTVKFLSETGAHLNVLDENKRNVLHYICAKDIPVISHIEFLVSNDVSTNQPDRQGQTALIYLCRAKQLCVKALKIMIKARTNVNHTDSRHATALHYLCERRELNLDCIAMLIKQGADVNIQTEEILGKQTALHMLCQSSDIDKKCLSVILTDDTDVNKTDLDGKTAFHYLCENGSADKETIEALLCRKVNIKQCSESIDGIRKSPVQYLCLREKIDVDILDVLIREGADVDHVDEAGKSALHYISSKHTVNLDAIKLLVKHGANINQCDNRSNSVFHYICRHRNADESIIKYFLDKDVDLNLSNTNGQTALHVSCDAKNYDAVCRLITHDADVNIVDADGRIPLHYVCSVCDEDDVTINDDDKNTEESFIDEGDYDDEGISFDSPVDITSEGDKEDEEQVPESELVTMLVNKGSDVHKQDKWGYLACPKMKMRNVVFDPSLSGKLRRTDLMNAVLEDNMTQVTKLLEVNDDDDADDNVDAAADVTAVDLFGRTALHYLCMSDTIDLEVIGLLTRVSNVNKTDKYGNTAPHYFCRLKANEIATDVAGVVETFLRDGLHVNKQDEYGRSVLFYLRSHFNADMISVLVSYCKNLNEENGDGMTLLQYLCAAHSSDCLRSLLPVITDVNKPVGCDVYGTYVMDYTVVIPRGQTALHLACRSSPHDAEEIVKMLIEAKANVDIKDSRKWTPEDYCLNQPSCHFEWTPKGFFVLPSATTEDEKGKMEILKLLSNQAIPVSGCIYHLSKPPL